MTLSPSLALCLVASYDGTSFHHMQGAIFSITLISVNNEETRGNPAFRGVLTDSSGGMVTATLTSLSEASTVEGTMVECMGESSQEGPLTITVAGELTALCFVT